MLTTDGIQRLGETVHEVTRQQVEMLHRQIAYMHEQFGFMHEKFRAFDRHRERVEAEMVTKTCFEDHLLRFKSEHPGR